MQLPILPPDCVHVYNQFTIRTPRRDALKKFLTDRSVPSEIYYPYPLHLQPAFSYLGHKLGDLPRSESASAEVLSLPIYPELTEEQLQNVVAAVADFHCQAQ